MLQSRTDLIDTSEKAVLFLLTVCLERQMLDTQNPGLLVRQTWMPLDGALRFKSRLLAYAFTRTCRSARQRYDILFICDTFWRINFILPHLFLLSLLQMCHCWHLISDAHVRAVVVIEVDVALNDIIGMLKGIETFPVDTFHLYFTINALGNGVWHPKYRLGVRNQCRLRLLCASNQK